MAGQDWFEKDFYAVLGVPVDATASDIKKAYRKSARQFHPDASPGDSSADKRFKEIGEAYSVLSDPEQRQQYDAIRSMSRGGARFTAGGGGSAGGGPGGAAGFEDIFGNLFGGAGAPPAGGQRVRYQQPGTGGPGGAGSPIFEDMLNGMFTGGGPAPGAGQYRSPRTPPKGEDLAASSSLTFSQALNGALLSLRVDDPYANGLRTITARIPAGVKNGQKVRLRGKGRASEYGGPPGDLVVTVAVEAHPLFTIDGNDVRLTVPLTFAEAALGAQIDLPTPQGGKVTLKVPAGTPSGRTMRVRGRGVQSAKGAGDLLVGIQVAVPQRLSSAAKDALNAFAEATKDENPRDELFSGTSAARAGASDADG
jgi:molecular chaperone DnaJ